MAAVYEAQRALDYTFTGVTSEFVRPEWEVLLERFRAEVEGPETDDDDLFGDLDFHEPDKFKLITIIDRMAEIGEDAAESLLAAWKLAVEPLIAAMSDVDERMRRNAAKALGALGDARAFQPLIAALSDADEDVRGSAVSALGMRGDARAVEPLSIRLSNEENYSVFNEIITALGRIGNLQAIQSLTELASNDKFAIELRQQAIRQLGKISDDQAISSIIDLMKDNDNDIFNTSVNTILKLFTSNDQKIRQNLLVHNESLKTASDRLKQQLALMKSKLHKLDAAQSAADGDSDDDL